MTSKDLPTLNYCINALMDRLVLAQDQLRRCELSCGTGHDVRRMNRLRNEIRSLETRLARTERLQGAALTARETNP